MWGSKAKLRRRAYAAWRGEDWRAAGELLEGLTGLDPDGRSSAAWWFDAAGRCAGFDEILLWKPSELPTLTATVRAPKAEDVEALIELFATAGFGAEPQDSVRPVCACCSAGTVTQHRQVIGGSQVVRPAAPRPDAARLLDEWRADLSTDRDWSGLSAVK